MSTDFSLILSQNRDPTHRFHLGYNRWPTLKYHFPLPDQLNIAINITSIVVYSYFWTRNMWIATFIHHNREPKSRYTRAKNQVSWTTNLNYIKDMWTPSRGENTTCSGVLFDIRAFANKCYARCTNTWMWPGTSLFGSRLALVCVLKVCDQRYADPTECRLDTQ